jgi:hypothetical protein
MNPTVSLSEFSLLVSLVNELKKKIDKLEHKISLLSNICQDSKNSGFEFN